MKRRILTAIPILAAIFTLASCGSLGSSGQKNDAPAPSPDKDSARSLVSDQRGDATGSASAADAPTTPFAGDVSAANQSETRYSEYRDSEDMLRLKLAQLDYINKSRKKYGAPPVALDILASRVANRMAKEAVRGGFTGHWNMRGEKPYQRFSFAGGTDHVSENAAASWSSAAFDAGGQSYARLMREAHDNFMAEAAPNDGHKRNCINPVHNYVGIGVYLEGGQFRYYEEFIDRYLEFTNVETRLAVNEETFLTVKPLRIGDIAYALIVYYEALPAPMTPAQINRMGSYPDFTNSTALQIWPWELEKYRSGNVYKIPVKFGKPGSYYANVFISDKPYSRTHASTADKIQASGVVFIVK
jgi:uncharacterized protein YkwD